MRIFRIKVLMLRILYCIKCIIFSRYIIKLNKNMPYISFLNRESESQKIYKNQESFSQAYQDLFVRIMTDFKSNGTYIEIGSSSPKENNNSYILERDLTWSGTSWEINSQLAKEFNKIRKNQCLNTDATVFDFANFLRWNMKTKDIDYLSLDIEPSKNTLKVLENLLLTEFRFGVITFEHDKYSSGPQVMLESRKLLENNGYVRVVSNVLVNGRDFEDWYVDPNQIQERIWRPYLSWNIECKKIFRNFACRL